MWAKEQIEDHKKAAKILFKIINQTFSYIKKHKIVTELEVQELIQEFFKKNKLRTANQLPIVAFGASAAMPHYCPTKKSNQKLEEGDMIKIDIWGKLNKKSAPFADITWMAIRGNKISSKQKKVFKIVIDARDAGIKYIKNQIEKRVMPTGKETDDVVRNYIHKYGFGEKFIHGTGHSLGITSAHGNLGRIRKTYKKPLRKNVAYTIEPGIYINGEFGVRSEIDFYIDEKFKFVLTTKLQRKIIIV